MSKKRMLAVLGAMAAFALVVGVAPVSANQPGTYEVTIENLTGGQPFTPALVATHKGNDGFFRVGKAASFGLKEIAENGNLGPEITRVTTDRDFFDSVVQLGPTIDPILPGEKVSFSIDAAPPFNFISWASMLICTNDGFTGVNKVKLPSKVGRSVTVYAQGYDAGTEVNTELFNDIVPPCGPLTGQDSMGQGTGMSNPALAEGGVIHHHGGILGAADLDATINDWDNPVAVITIERTG